MSTKTRRTIGAMLFGMGGSLLYGAFRAFTGSPYWLGGVFLIVAVALMVPGWRMLKRSQADEALESAARYDADLARYEAQRIREQAQREQGKSPGASSPGSAE